MPDNIASIFSCARDNTIKCYDLGMEKLKFSLSYHKHNAFKMIYKKNFHYLLSVSCDRYIQVSDAIVGRSLAQLTGHADPIVCMEDIPNTMAVASVDLGNTFKLWDLKQMTCVQTIVLTSHIRNITSMACLHPIHPHIAIGSQSIHFLVQKQAQTRVVRAKNSEKQSLVWRLIIFFENMFLNR